jgi:predicted DNA-binding transcriptional regulator YafY
MNADDRGRIHVAMQDPDGWVVSIDYRREDGVVHRRTVSPIRWRPGRVVALCLAREEPRSFRTDRIQNVRMIRAETVQMPTEIVELNPEEPTPCPNH